jgi:phosphoglycerate dehydrogenase-like enzyme
MKIVSTTPRTNQNIDNFVELIHDSKYEFVEVFPKKQHFKSNEMKKILSDCFIAIVGDDEVDLNAIEDAKYLTHIIKWGSGTDSIDLEEVKKHKINVLNTPGILGKYVAEYVLGIIISTNRNLFEYSNTFKQKQMWNKTPGSSLFGKKIGLFGYGNIGKEISKLLKPFDCEVYFYDPYVEPCDDSKKIELLELYEISDILIISANLNLENYQIINKQSIDKLKNNCFLINISRGQLLNEKDIFEAIKKKQLNSVFLDVFDVEPPNLDDYYLDDNKINFSQHNASNSNDAIEEVNLEIIEIIKGLIK